MPVLGCATASTFQPFSDYPPDPWVKGYADPEDCLGGETLAAIKIDLPEYPSRAFKTGRQGWAIVRLDINADGLTENVEVQRVVPKGAMFASPSKRAVSDWLFEPPENGGLTSCRVLLKYRLGTVSLRG